MICNGLGLHIPRVSVIIPVYNCDRYIGQAIESVLGQTYTDYELLVIDDGSTDSTPEQVNYWSDRLRYIRQENQGVAVARNHGLQLAQGELIAFLDADDWFLPDKLAAQVAMFDQQPQLGIVHSGWQRVSAAGDRLLDVKPWQTIPELTLESWLHWKPVLPSAMMFRRKWLLKTDGFDPRFPPAEDTDLVLRLSLMGCQATWLPQITTCYRQHDASAMHKGLPQARSLTAVMHHFFAQPSLPDSIRRLKPQILYSTWVWIAWYLYSTGHVVEMVNYLQQAWPHRPHAPIDTLISWAESFAAFSNSWGTEIDMDALCCLPEWQELMAWCWANS
jgi:glycosyltransferase involved in cell wall biosynthesis